MLALAVGVPDGAVLGEDGDAALALQGVGVHDAVALEFVLAELAALAQQLVDQRGLAVVDVGDNGNVPNLFALHACLSKGVPWKKKGQPELADLRGVVGLEAHGIEAAGAVSAPGRRSGRAGCAEKS